MKTGITDRTDRTATGDHDRGDRDTATAGLNRPRHIPARNWRLAVKHVQAHAREFPHFWPCWCQSWKRFLRRISDGSRGDVFNKLFMIYLESGGTGSTFCRSAGTEVTWADVADAMAGVNAGERAADDGAIRRKTETDNVSG